MLKRLSVIFLYTSVVFFCLSVQELQKFRVGFCSKVLDGDTVIVNAKRLRLFGLDAPEKKQMAFNKSPIGMQSKDWLVNRIQGHWVIYKDLGRGVYNRVLATVYKDGKNINEQILELGYAIPSYIKKEKKLFLLNYLAITLSKGIYSFKSSIDNPKNYRSKQRHK